jgi:importin subunit alpha-1
MASSGAITSMMEYMSCKDAKHFIPALRGLGNVASGEDHDIVDTMIQLGLFEKLNVMMNSCSSNIKKEICWVMSNLMAGV